MKPTVRENTVLHFKPTQHLAAIKAAIIQQCLQKKCRQQQETHAALVGGLPSPPVEEKKVMPEPVVLMATSGEIREKIQRLTDEKHRLFQMLKQLMVKEEQKKKKKKSRWAPVSSDQAYFYPRRYQSYQQQPHYVSRTFSR